MKKRLLVALFVAAVVFPTISLADPAGGFNCAGETYPSGFVPLACYQGSAKLTALYSGNGPNALSSLINNLFTILLSIGAMAAVLRLVYAGYIRMISGVGSWASMGKANEIIGNTIFGILLLLGVYLILHQINPQILNLNITFPTSTATPARNQPGQSTPVSNGNCVDPTPTEFGNMCQNGYTLDSASQVCCPN